MQETGRSRIRIRLPSGAEIETEGTEEFARQEAQRLLAHLESPAISRSASSDPAQALWAEIVDTHQKGLLLRSRPSPQAAADACLLLLGAAKTLLSQSKPTATQLARWLRLSGCPVKRVDRVLNGEVQKGDILASGARRSRRYELSAAGFKHANLLASQLAHDRLDPERTR